jgi:hypothetical protein
MKYFKEYGSEFTIQYCSQEEVRKLMQVAKAKGPRELAMFSLLFGTGLRLQEAVDLRTSNITADTVLVRGKGQKVREVYLPQETRKALSDYIQMARTKPDTREDYDYVFTTKAARKMSYDFFRKICQDVAFAAGVKFHPHMARHTYATDLLKRGVSILYVSRLLGHEDLDSTSIYLHPSQADAIDAAREAIDSQKAQESNSMDRRGGEHPKDGGIDTGEDEDDPPGELKEKALLLFFGELMQHPVRRNSSRVGINATPSPDAVRSALNHHFLSPINATPREDKCNTINATPVRKSP